MTRRPITLAIATTVVTLAALAPAGGATPRATVAQAEFRATLSGSQITTWQLRRVQPKDEPCMAGATGDGDQTIRFKSARRFGMTFTRPPKGQPDMFQTKGRPAVLTAPLFLTLEARAERNGELQVHTADLVNCHGENGGGVDPSEQPKDCGARAGILKARFFFHDRSADDDIFVPLGPPLPEKNRLKLEGSDYEWTQPGGETSSSTLGDTFKNCPWGLSTSRIAADGAIYTAAERLSERALFDKSRRSFVVSGSVIQPHGDSEESGQTILAWNLRLTRVR